MNLENSLPAKGLRHLTVSDIHDMQERERYIVTCPLQNQNCVFAATDGHDTMADYRAEALVKWPWCESCGCDLVVVDTKPS